MTDSTNEPVEVTEGKGQYRYYRDGDEGRVVLSAGTFARVKDWLDATDVDHGVDHARREVRVAEAEVKDPTGESDAVVVDQWGENRYDDGEVGRRVEFIVYLYESELVVGEMSPCGDGWNSNRQRIAELEAEISEMREYIDKLEPKLDGTE